MYITINGTDYERIKALSFAPEVDPAGMTLPISGFEADIFTSDAAEAGQYAELRDDLGRLWADYYITRAVRVDADILRIRAESPLTLIARDVLPATYYNAAPIADVLVDVFRNTGSGLGVYIYQLDQAFSGAVITGFAPRQSARERLLWACFAIGAQVVSCFGELIGIVPADAGNALIPMRDTFWRPAASEGDCVTAIRAFAYSFAPGVPTSTDKWVQDDGGTTYVVTTRAFELRNPDAPPAAPENVISLEGMYFLNDGNVAAAMSRLAAWRFNPRELTLECIDNADYRPGMRVTVCDGLDGMMTGVVRQATFRFGVQARARLKLAGASAVASAALTIRYLYGDIEVGRSVFRFPVGYDYAVANPYIDTEMNGHRYVLRPLEAVCAGRMAQGDVSADVACAVALDLCGGMLHVISVDGAEASNDKGVIA